MYIVWQCSIMYINVSNVIRGVNIDVTFISPLDSSFISIVLHLNLLRSDVVIDVLYIRLFAFLSSTDDVMGPYVSPIRVPPGKLSLVY